VIVPGAEQAFPAADGERQNAFQLVVLGFVRPVHQSRHQAEAAGVVSGCAHAGLHKRARDGIHLDKARIGQAFLRGERVSGEGCAQRGEAESVAGIKKTVCARRSLKFDERGGRREQRVNRSQAVVGQKGISQPRISSRGRERKSSSG
jgi:hypothetical protein